MTTAAPGLPGAAPCGVGGPVGLRSGPQLALNCGWRTELASELPKRSWFVAGRQNLRSLPKPVQTHVSHNEDT